MQKSGLEKFQEWFELQTSEKIINGMEISHKIRELIKEEEMEEGYLMLPDIRNKLGSVVSLVSMLEKEKKELVEETIPIVKRAVNYLAQREVYPKEEESKPISPKYCQCGTPHAVNHFSGECVICCKPIFRTGKPKK